MALIHSKDLALWATQFHAKSEIELHHFEISSEMTGWKTRLQEVELFGNSVIDNLELIHTAFKEEKGGLH